MTIYTYYLDGYKIEKKYKVEKKSNDEFQVWVKVSKMYDIWQYVKTFDSFDDACAFVEWEVN